MAVPLTSLSHGAGCGCKLSAADLRPIVAGLPAPGRPARARRDRHLRRRRCRAPDRRPRDRADRRLLHADRRRPLLVRPDRRHQRALRHLRDGRRARLRAESRRVPARDARRESLREILRGGAGRRGWRRARRSSAGTRSTTRSPSTGSRSRASCTPTRCCATPAAGRATRWCSPSRSARARSPRRSSAAWRRRSSWRAAIEVMTTLNARAACGPRGGRPRADRRDGLRAARSHPRARAGRRLAARSTPRPSRRSRACLSCWRRAALAGGSRRNRADADDLHVLGRRRPGSRARLVCDAMTSGGLLAAVSPRGRGRSTAGSSATRTPASRARIPRDILLPLGHNVHGTLTELFCGSRKLLVTS